MIKHLVEKFTSNKLGQVLHDIVARYRSRNVEPSSPQCLHIETISMCNARCIMCAHRTMARNKSTMTDELFEKVATQALTLGVKWINLQFYGEPLLDKKIFDRVKYLKSLGFKVKFNTNGSLLDEKNIKYLLDTGIDQVNISFDAFTKEEYSKIRVGLDYDKVIHNIEQFYSTIKQRKANIRIVMTFICLQSNKHEAKMFKRRWKKVANQIIIAYVRDWAGQLDVSGVKPSISSVNKNICKSLWKDLIILQDGRVALCCSDFEGLGNMGNANDQNLNEIWNGPKFKHYRNLHRQGRRSELQLCKNCESYSFWWKI